MLFTRKREILFRFQKKLAENVSFVLKSSKIFQKLNFNGRLLLELGWKKGGFRATTANESQFTT